MDVADFFILCFATSHNNPTRHLSIIRGKSDGAYRVLSKLISVTGMVVGKELIRLVFFNLLGSSVNPKSIHSLRHRLPFWPSRNQ